MSDIVDRLRNPKRALWYCREFSRGDDESLDIQEAADEIERLQGLVAKGLAVVHDFLPNIGRCVLQDYQRMNEFCSEAAARAGDSAIDDLKVSIAPSVAELWVCDCGWKNIDREGVCFACQKPRATSTVEASRNGK